jgi:hypothetical protein
MNLLTKFFDLGFRRRIVRIERDGEPNIKGAIPEASEDSSSESRVPLFELDGKVTAALYIFVFLGALAKNLLDFLASKSGTGFDWRLILISLVLAAVGFPRIFEDRLTKVSKASLRYFIAFENGFFIDAVVRAVANFYHRS